MMCYWRQRNWIVQLPFILWMTFFIHDATGQMTTEIPNASDSSTTRITTTEQTLSGNATAFLMGGKSLSVVIPYASSRGFYEIYFIQTDPTYGFQVAFRDLYLDRDNTRVLIGTGHDPDDTLSLITTLRGIIGFYNDPDYVYVDTNEMWLAVIGDWEDGRIRMDADITAIDLLNLFPCWNSNMNVSVTLVCDGYYNCDNYEDELSCSRTTSFLPGGKSLTFYKSYSSTTSTKRSYEIYFIQTDPTYGFQFAFRDLYLWQENDQFLIGTGNDPSDMHSVNTTFRGFIHDPDDVYVETSEMWFAVIGDWEDSLISMDLDITAIDLLNLYPCWNSTMTVSVTLVCDGYYNCDNYEDELLCNQSASFLHPGESIFIAFPLTENRLFLLSLLRTNLTGIFRIEFQYGYRKIGGTIQIGTGNDPTDNQSVVNTFHDHTFYPVDLYVRTFEIWITVTSRIYSASGSVSLKVTAIDVLDLLQCANPNTAVTPSDWCDGDYTCPDFGDEAQCHAPIFLYENEDPSILFRSVNEKSYYALLLKTNSTHGFRIKFLRIFLSCSGYSGHYGYCEDVSIQIGTSNDPSNSQSIVQTVRGYTTYEDDFYVGTNEMWITMTGLWRHNFDGSSEIEISTVSLSNLSSCPNSRKLIIQDEICDGTYQCDDYWDEISCGHPDILLQEGESFQISISDITHKTYNRTHLRTNSSLGFRVLISYVDIGSGAFDISLGMGRDRQNVHHIVQTNNNDADDVYVTTNQMWIALIDIDGEEGSHGHVAITITSVTLPVSQDLYFCSTNSSIGIPLSKTCDGLYDCADYRDESSCSQPTLFLSDGETYMYILYDGFNRRNYRVWLFETNSTIGFQIDLYDVNSHCYRYNNHRYCEEATIQIGKGKDLTDQESVISTFNTVEYYQLGYGQWYVNNHELWISVLGYKFAGDFYSKLRFDVTAVNLSSWFICRDSKVSISENEVCNGRYECNSYEDEISCDRSTTVIGEGESYAISDLELSQRDYHVFLLKANFGCGFHIKFQHIFLDCCDMNVQIGSGNDTSDERSVVKSIRGYANYVDDIEVTTSTMWLLIAGGKNSIVGHVDIILTAVNVSDLEYVCLSTPCQNGGTCHLTNSGYQCDCNDPFTGQNCEIEDVCLSMPCQKGGTCRLVINSGYHCDCPDPFIGQNCEREDACLAMPCQNGATCRLTNSGYHCDCIDPFTGQYCEIGSTDPCTILDPCVNGVCRKIGQGQYECDCLNYYEGINCDEPTLPIEVSIHPVSQIVNINAAVELSCGFNNVKKYSWYKDDVPLPNTENQKSLIIPNVLLDDIGYYFCRGYGRGGETLDTMRASVYIKDLTNIEVLNARFAIPFRDELHNQTSALYRYTTSNISAFMEQGLRTSTGLVGLSVVCRALRPGSIKADMNIYFEQANMTAFETQHLVGQSLNGLSHDSKGFFDSSILYIQNNAICQNITWMSPRFGRVDFPVGENGTWANSTGLCPFNTTHAYEPVGRALCTGDGIIQSQWLPMDNCGPLRNVTDILTEIVKVNVTEENAGELSEQVSVVTSNTEQITSEDIVYVAEITSQIVQQNVTTEEVTESITSIVSNIAQVDAEELEAAEEENGAVSQFVQAFEEQINRVAVADGEMLNIQRPKVAVQVQSVPNDDVLSGLVLSVAGSDLSDLAKSNITISAERQHEVTPTRPNVIAQVNIPPSVSSLISSTSPESQSNTRDHVRVTFNLYSTPVLFISKSLRNISVANEEFNRSANSPVLSLTLGQRKVEALTEFINFTFITIMSGYINPMCSFWDENERDWSQDGCVLISYSGLRSSDGNYSENRREVSNDERVRCACDHLTNFAVIMDIHRQPEEDRLIKAYSTLTYIGCGISVFSLLVTLATYLWHKDLRTKQNNQIFICLCLTMLCLYITFIVMISLDSIRNYREVQPGPCGFLTALIHYFVLSSIAWMGVEGYNTYLIIVKIFNTYIPNFMLKASLAAWGVPALVVVLTGAIARDHYAHGDQCFLQLWAQIGGLLIPMSIILLINIVIFILVVRRLIRSASIAGRVKSDSRAQRRETIQRVQNAICILLLLGLTWVTGYLLLIPEFTQVAQPIFIVLNSFQGMFIFLLYCVRKPQIRKEWGLTCFEKLLDHEPSTSSGRQSSKTPSSFPCAISGLRPGASDMYWLPTKDDHPDPLCMYNPTYDVDEVNEGVKPAIKDLPSSTNGQKKDTDAGDSDVALFSLHADASVTLAAEATEGSDGVASTTDDAAVSLTVDSTDAIKGN